MRLHSTWVDHLFAKLTVRYGAAFMRQWPSDTDVVLLKADWAEVLGGFAQQPDGLTHALENLPDTPPNALQFRALARRAPRSDALALSAPGADKPAAVVLQRLQSVKRRLQDHSPAQQCIDNIERIVAGRGGKISQPQREMVASCLRMSNTHTTLPGMAEILGDVA